MFIFLPLLLSIVKAFVRGFFHYVINAFRKIPCKSGTESGTTRKAMAQTTTVKGTYTVTEISISNPKDWFIYFRFTHEGKEYLRKYREGQLQHPPLNDGKIGKPASTASIPAPSRTQSSGTFMRRWTGLSSTADWRFISNQKGATSERDMRKK